MASPTPYSFKSSALVVSTSVTVLMPNNPDPSAADRRPAPGMLLTAFVSGDSISSDAMSGWTKLGAITNGTQMINVFHAVALGDGADADGTATGAGIHTRGAWVVATANWDGVPANVALGAASANSLDPTSLNMGASRDHLFIAAARNGNNITAAPTNYVNLNVVSGAHWLAVATRQVTTQTEDPGAFTGTLSAGSAGVVGIRPGSAGQVPGGRFMPFFA